jgi:putative Mn2+ efflux pump MntP
MSNLDLVMISVGLSMDAFAVSICKGLSTQSVKVKNFLSAGLWFGSFQAFMPLIGYFLGVRFQGKIQRYDHWVALILLCVIGFNMIRESLAGKEEADCSFSAKSMFPLAVATSIDALTVGVMFGLTNGINIAFAISLIGLITFAFSAVGVALGNVFGKKFQQTAGILGGVILIVIGLKIFLEHTVGFSVFIR